VTYLSLDQELGIGKITPSGAITLFPQFPHSYGTGALTVGPDGNLWFIDGNAIGRITPAGDSTEFSLPMSEPISVGKLTLGPDGNFWFPDLNGHNDIVRVNLDQPLSASPSTFAVTPGVSFSGAVASFTDTDPASNPNSYRATIDWGDGSPPSNGTITVNGTGGYVVNGTHTYTALETYHVTVTISDIDTANDLGGATAVALSIASPAPSVTGVASVTHAKKGITAIVLDFSEGLNPGSAGNGSFYSIASGVKKRHKLLFAKNVKIGGVSYDGNAHTVTLSLAKPFKGKVQVMVRSGILATNGTSTEGNFTSVVS
jgi:hypothetical protein